MNYYEKNIEALKKHHPELIDLIESTEIGQDRIQVFYSETGEPRILYKKDDGEEVFIHSAEDPSKCANQAVDLLGKMEKEGVAVLLGFGLGYFAEEVLKRFEKGHILLVYEATPALFKTALKLRDLSALFESGQVKIILGEGNYSLVAIHTYHHHILNGKYWIVKHHPSVKLNEKAYERFQKKLGEEKQYADTNLGTAISIGKEFVHSYMLNIHSFIRKPGVGKLKDIFKGRPAIVVSAGPSLEKNFHLLKKAKGKALIIVVDVVLPTLLPAGIVPDFIVAIDPMAENIAVFRDNPMLRHVPFICLAQYTPEVLNTYPGPLFINSSPGNIISQWLGGFWEDKGYIECFGGSVAHLALSAAEYMGSDAIAIIGQDMSYEGKYHAGDTTKILHDYHDQDVPDYTKGAMTIENIFGEKRYTSTGLLSFKHAFEKKIETFKGTIVHATEGGLPLEGSKTMRLFDFIEEYCNVPDIDTFSVLSEIEHGEVSYNLDGLLTQSKGAKAIFINIKKNAEKVLKYIHKAEGLKDAKNENDSELHKTLRKMENLTDKIKNPILNIIASYHYQLELYLMRQSIKDIDEIEDKWEKLDAQLYRGVNYYGELIEAIGLFAEQLDKLIKALELETKVNSILMDKSLSDDERFYKAGMIYKKVGMATQAVKYLELVSSNRELQVSLAEMYLKQFRFYEAKEILIKVASSQQPVAGKKTKGKDQAEKIRELLKECEEKIKAWEERKERMTQLLKKAEENYGGDLESGYFYFRVKDYDRAEKAYLKAVASGQEPVGRKEETVASSQDSVARKEETGTSSQKESLATGYRSPAADVSAAYYGLAHVYLAKGEVEQAVEAFEKAIENDPKNPLPYRDLGMMAYQNNNIESAELFFTRAIELAPQALELYKLLCDLYVGQSEYQKAISLYEDALLANPDNPVIQQELATLYKILISRTGTA